MTDSTPAPRPRRALQFSLRITAIILFVTLLGCVAGFVVRDRWPILALLMYLPPLPIGVVAIVWDVAARGRGLSRRPYILGITGALAAMIGVAPMLGGGLSDVSVGNSLTVLHWNVRWGGGGGGRDGEPSRWQSICSDVARHAPDIVILSEAPGEGAVSSLSGMSFARSANAPRDRYLYSMVVASRWPVQLERESAIPTGRVMQAVVAAPGGDVRVLVVDGESYAWLERTPRLRAVAQICRDAEVSGNPIDLIAGDFNAVGRSIGFDAIRDVGFTSAGAAASGWRATWPAICPLYDIDHVWVSSRRWAMGSVGRFTNLATDHRGQVARIRAHR